MSANFSLRAVLVCAVSLGAAASATAQPVSRFFVGASVGTFSVNADDVDGRSGAGGIVGGVRLSRFVDAEVEIVLPAQSIRRSYSGISVSFAPPGATRAEIERLGVVTRFDSTRDVRANVSGVVIFHPPLTSRVTPGLIVGVSNQFARVRRDYTPISIPPGVDPSHPSVIARTESSTRNFGGLTVGGNISIALTPRLSLVPDVRYDYGSIGDEINNAWRSSVGVVYRF